MTETAADEEGEGAGESEDEFGEAGTADDVARGTTVFDEGAGDEGTPTASAEGVYEAADEGEDGDVDFLFFGGLHFVGAG